MRVSSNVILNLFESSFSSLLSIVILACVIFLSAAMILISSWSKKKTVFISGVLVSLCPGIILLNSMAIAFSCIFNYRIGGQIYIVGDGLTWFRDDTFL